MNNHIDNIAHKLEIPEKLEYEIQEYIETIDVDEYMNVDFDEYDFDMDDFEQQCNESPLTYYNHCELKSDDFVDIQEYVHNELHLEPYDLFDMAKVQNLFYMVYLSENMNKYQEKIKDYIKEKKEIKEKIKVTELLLNKFPYVIRNRIKHYIQ